MSKWSVVLLGVGVLLWAGRAGAQDDGVKRLSIGESVTIMLGQSHALHSSKMEMESADARAQEARSAGLMTAKLSAAYTRLSDVPSFSIGPPLLSTPITIYPAILNNYTARLSLQQPLFAGSRFSGAIALADNMAGAALEEYNQDRAELILAVKSAYWKLYLAREIRSVIAENVRQTEAHLNDIRHLFEQGMATKNDVLRVEVQYSEAKVRQISADNNAQLALNALNNILGIPLQTPVELTTELYSESLTIPPLESLLEHAHANRSDLRAALLRKTAAEEGVAMARSAYYPQISLFGNFYYSRPNQRLFPAKDEFRDTWDVGVSLSWDLWNWGATRHQATQAERRVDQSNDGIQQLTDAITLEVTQAFLALKESQQRIVVAKKGVDQGEENYRSIQNKFKNGLVVNAELTDAEAALLSTKWIHIQALADYNLAIAQLEKAAAIELFAQ